MKKLIFCLAVVLTTQIAYAQIETKIFPKKDAFEKVGILKKNSKAEKIRKMPAFNLESMLKEDDMNEGKDVPFRFGKGFDVDISLSDGTWIEVDKGRLWSLQFESSGAYSINFIFDDFYLPEGGNLYIGNTGGTMLYGPVTSKENTKDGRFLTDLIAGDKVTVYLFEPKDKLGLAKLKIKRIVHGYKNSLSSDSYGNYGGSWPCNNDVVCFPEWNQESDAVGLVLLSNGDEWCSGSLLMSANQSFRPYFLSAFHCIDSNQNGELSQQEISDSQNWLFKFQYKKSSCGGNSATTGITFNSATFRSAWNSSDFSLMEMNASLLGDSRFVWLGWDRSGNNPTSGTGIHHPAGDVMKISFDNDIITPNNQTIDWGGNNISPINSHWTVGYDNGTTQGGSSGSPLFNDSKRVVGQLHGGVSDCAPVIKRYGRFNVSWTGGGTDATRLSNWLDPTGIGALTTNTSRHPTISGPSQVCGQATYTINNLPAGATVVWNSNGLSPSSGTGTSFTASPVSYAGAGYVRATITVGSSTFAVSKNVEFNGYTPIDGPDEEYLSTVKAYFTMDESVTVLQWAVNGVVMYPANPHRLILSPLSNYFPGKVMITCTATSGCGTFTAIKDFEVIDDMSYSLYPNPASDQVQVTMLDTSSSSLQTTSTVSAANTTTNSYSVKVLDLYGSVVYTSTKVGKQFTIPTSKFGNGVYNVIISDGSKTYQKKLVIKH